MSFSIPRLGYFSRLLDDASPADRYRLATEQIVHAEQFGFDSAWVAQHHFSADEGGLPAPLVFLSNVAARTSRIRLGTGIVTLPLEDPVRLAEDAAVLDLLSDGRVEIGLGSGGTPSSFPAFGRDSADRGAIFAENLRVLLTAWRGGTLTANAETVLYPPAPRLLNALWQATFSAAGGARAGAAGDGLMLSRTQPRPASSPDAPLWQVQEPIVDAYLDALPAGVRPRIVGSRSVFVADDRDDARRLAERGLRRVVERFRAAGQTVADGSLDELIVSLDVHVGTPDEVIESLSADRTLGRVTELACQVHSVDPPHEYVLRSIELIATEVAPALGWAGAKQVQSTNSP